MTGPALSCYTTSLVTYLEGIRPDAATAFAAAVRLAVRTDLPDGRIAFSHHHRVDRWAGQQLGYAHAGGWDAAREEIAAEATRHGQVIAVANTAAMPWSPSYARQAVPHWLLVGLAPAGGWQVTDEFAAIMPSGEQQPFRNQLTDAELCIILRPGSFPGAHVPLRDCHALGEYVPAPKSDQYRWLGLEPLPPASHQRPDPPGLGNWQLTTAGALRWLAGRLSDDPVVLRECLDDLWAAARHHTFLADPNDELTTAWAELPQAMRFAADSAARGRPRPSLVRASLNYVADLTESARAGQHGQPPARLDP
jgi:hypothetical protein